MKFLSLLLALALFPLLAGCSNGSKNPEEGSKKIPTIGYIQVFEDPTLDAARKGFVDALKEKGFNEDSGTVRIVFRSAQNDQANVPQILDYFISEKVDAIATNPTVAMIAAVGKTKTIPIFMMVGPSPEIAGIAKPDSSGKMEAPANLSGVYETLEYIDTSVALIRQTLPNAKKVGTIFNSSEPNSVNAMNRLRTMCKNLGLELVEASVTSSNETQQVMASLVDKNIDVFFALPDNIIFASFETINKLATEKKIPVVTSEAGLVARGAFIAYGADFYQWGHQAGLLAAKFLQSGNLQSAPLELVKVRGRVFNPKAATDLGITPPSGFVELK
ncbi:MAG: ABC transporter substrate-binding protein [Chlorobi bacterium]|nr:MAG: ABC transporter substrate binding protein [Chlorobi bacterium OLB7]MBK8912385.1 ABC transporter substrate-binding protein [Chlorobiota bacterium]